MIAAIGIAAAVLAAALWGEHQHRTARAAPGPVNLGHVARALADHGCHPAVGLSPNHLHGGIAIACAPTAGGGRDTVEIAGGWARPDGVLLATVLRHGGSGAFTHLHWLTAGGGDRVALGDRTTDIGLAETADGLTLTMTVHGPDDPRCCPTQRTSRRVVTDGDRLRLLEP